MNNKYVISIILLLVAFWKMIELPNLWKEQAVLCLECHGFCRFSSSGVFLRLLQILSYLHWVMFSRRKWRNEHSGYMQFFWAQNHNDELFLHLNERWKLWEVIQGFLKLVKRLSASNPCVLFVKLQTFDSDPRLFESISTKSSPMYKFSIAV